MATLPSIYYHRGDQVLILSGSREHVPGRVINASDRYIKVAYSTPFDLCERNGLRVLPTGTPVYDRVDSDEIELVAHDPGWDPYCTLPFLTPLEYGWLGGWPNFPMPSIPGLTHVGAYLGTRSYDPDDPVWAWEADAWRKAVVIESKRNWIAVRYVDGYRHPTRGATKSYYPARIWPMLCDHPGTIRRIAVEGDWVKIPSQSHARLASRVLCGDSRLGAANPGR